VKKLSGLLFLIVAVSTFGKHANASICDWLDRSYLDLTVAEDRDLLAAFEAIPEGKTKASWIEQLEKTRDDLEARVPGATLIDLETGEFQRVVDGKLIGSIYFFRAGFDKVGGNLFRLHGDVDKNYQGQGVFKLLVLEAYLQNPSMKAILTTLRGTNAEVVEEGVRNGLSFLDAVKQTPAYKVRKSLGFTEIVYLRASGSGARMMIEFMVGRSKDILE